MPKGCTCKGKGVRTGSDPEDSSSSSNSSRVAIFTTRNKSSYESVEKIVQIIPGKSPFLSSPLKFFLCCNYICVVITSLSISYLPGLGIFYYHRRNADLLDFLLTNLNVKVHLCEWKLCWTRQLWTVSKPPCDLGTPSPSYSTTYLARVR